MTEAQPAPTAVKRPLKFSRLLIAAFVLLATLPIFLLAPVLIGAMREAMVAATQQQLAAETETFAERFRAARLTLESGLALLAVSDDVELALANAFFTEPATRQFEKFVTQNPNIASLLLQDTNGNQVAAFPEGRAESCPESAERDTIHSKVHNDHLFFRVPIYVRGSGQKRAAGFLCAALDTKKLLTQLSNDFRRPETQLDFSLNGNSLVRFTSAQVQAQTRLVTRTQRIQLSETESVTMTLSESEKSKLAPIQSATFWAAALALGLVAMSAAAGWRISRLLIQPLDMLTSLAESYSLGQFETEAGDARFREFQTVTQTFVTMKDRIVSQIETLRIIIRDLERLAEEGQALSSRLELPALIEQVRQSTCRLVGCNVPPDIHFSHQVFPQALPEGFYVALASGEADMESHRTDESFAGQNCLPVLRATDGVTLAYLTLNWDELPRPEEAIPLLHNLCVTFANTIENIQFVHNQREQVRLKGELETARLVQKHLLPAVQAPCIRHFEIASFYRSASECGGDWWQYFPLSHDRLLILLGDVTGHGVASALVAAVVKGYCDSIYWRNDISASTILTDLNAVVRSSSDGTRLMTMFACVLDPASNGMRFANAAHNPPFLLRTGTGQLKRLTQIGGRLGFDETAPVEGEVTATIEPGDTLFLFSDGLVECSNATGEPFGEKRLKELLRADMHGDAGQIATAVESQMETFFAGHPQDDDITFLVVRFREDHKPPHEDYPSLFQYRQKQVSSTTEL